MAATAPAASVPSAIGAGPPICQLPILTSSSQLPMPAAATSIRTSSAAGGASQFFANPRGLFPYPLTDAVSKLALVLGLVVVALRLGDEAIVADRPLLVAADANSFARTSRPRIRADERPVILDRLVSKV